MSGFSPPPPPQAARALVRQLFSRRGSAPEISATLSDDGDSSRGTLEFLNEGGDAAGLACMCETTHGLQAFEVGGLSPGGVASVAISGVGHGDLRCVWTCSDARGRRYLWTYEGAGHRLRRHDKSELEQLFRSSYPAAG